MDRAWRFNKTRLTVNQNAKTGSAMIMAKVRSAQYEYRKHGVSREAIPCKTMSELLKAGRIQYVSLLAVIDQKIRRFCATRVHSMSSMRHKSCCCLKFFPVNLFHLLSTICHLSTSAKHVQCVTIMLTSQQNTPNANSSGINSQITHNAGS